MGCKGRKRCDDEENGKSIIELWLRNMVSMSKQWNSPVIHSPIFIINYELLLCLLLPLSSCYSLLLTISNSLEITNYLFHHSLFYLYPLFFKWKKIDLVESSNTFETMLNHQHKWPLTNSIYFNHENDWIDRVSQA